MRATLRTVVLVVVVAVMAALAAAQEADSRDVVANQNRQPAGKLEKGDLWVSLELRDSVWRLEAEDGPKLFVQAIGEAGHPPQIPGPLLRMPTGTVVHVKVSNKFKVKATVYGLNTRPGDSRVGVEIPAGESREWSFPAGAPGTYYYWARTTEAFKTKKRTVEQPFFNDAQMNGAFIIDGPGDTPPDRIFVMDAMFAPADILHEAFDYEFVSINGKSYPYTEPLEYTAGETIRWRVINTSFSEHPMHLHGSFYQVLSLGDYQSDTAFAPADRQSVVTQNMLPGQTMMIEWKPEHEGRWLFHCHFHQHISSDERVPLLRRAVPSVYDPPEPVAEHEGMAGMNDMAGLVLAVNVKPSAASAPRTEAAAAAHKVDLVLEPSAANGKMPTFQCKVREGKKLVASQDAMGPPIVVTRGEATEITVLNHLAGPTTIHWHGIELDSYYDGVIGGGVGNQITPAIAPGGSFTARFTPNRAGTFIYHTHAPNPDQLSGGVYGPLIVLEPGEQFDPEREKFLVVGSRDTDFNAKRLTLNGSEKPDSVTLNRGMKYRLRVVNIAPNLSAEIEIGSDQHPVTWVAISKDGADLPSRLTKKEDARLHIASGETYDFEFQPDAAGEIPVNVKNGFGSGKVTETFVVQ